MKKAVILLSVLFVAQNAIAQNQQDSLKAVGIQEVIVIKTSNVVTKEAKPLGSIDDYLQKSSHVEMIRRGAYAWEPTINSMATERTLVTIDGMKIFGACTDKMDPITSYVEVSNLSSAKVNSGQQGSCHGSTIGGSIDLVRTKGSFGQPKWNFNLNTGFESVNNQKILGGGVSVKNQKFYNETNFMMRDAENYYAGNHTEILHSQFKKYNLSETFGVKIGEDKLLEASVIYDKAKDVGYPALPMDVSLAEAIITSLKFQYHTIGKKLTNWETKFYYNHITHRMDDTKRPVVPIHMDMPGWSTTYGYYSLLNFDFSKHHVLVNINGYLNKSLAEMTMYPNDPSEKPMFMLTWPDVKTLSQALYVEDRLSLNENSSLKFSAAATLHYNKVESALGLESLEIFYPSMKSGKTRMLKNFAVNYSWKKDLWEAGAGLGYGDRAPSVSEGYGFYLFNSAEKYDYIGNPFLKNESSLEGNAFVGLKKSGFSAKLNVSYFNIQNYIVGQVVPNLIPMTIGAKGVKQYVALDRANILNVGLNLEARIHPLLKWSGQVTYNLGEDNAHQPLPYISPIAYRSALRFEKNAFSSEVSIIGNTKQSKFAAAYGETQTAAYALLNANVGYLLKFEDLKISTKVGVENIFDTYYATFSDWNKIPRPGRNFYINLGFQF